ncbi:Up-regulated during septation-domain-containing protein [Pisolithus thermaeus]|nr:Up-regulated during septation-domain-containing protein [Pisolithus croceorrhizus]KAI6166250.1 Up-regulated during septation-domain-containing protein [Pisolithus thermaeus]
MNGVRRLWGGGRTSPATPQPQFPATEAALPPTPPATASESLWSPQVSRSASPAVDEPPATTAGLTIRKTKQAPISSSIRESTSTSSPSSVHSHTRSTESRALSSPPRKSSGGSRLAGPSHHYAATPDSLPASTTNEPRRKRTSEHVDIRDELLMSLLTSEAIVDSRDCEILGAEEVEELKEEYQVLKIRLAAMEKKLNLDTKMRDAALSLSRINATHVKSSKQTDEQLEAAERKVAATQKEYWHVSERTREARQRLLEHCAGVLGYSMQKMEKAVNPPANGYDYNDLDTETPNSSLTMNSLVSPSTTRFDATHLFAGHADAQFPRLPSSASDVVELEAKLRAATESLNAANKQQADMARELQQLRLEKEQSELAMGAELQNRNHELSRERLVWEEDRAKLAIREREVEELQRRLDGLEAERLLVDVQREADAKMQQKEEEMSALERQLAEAREQWEAEKRTLEEEHLVEVGALQEELESLRESTEVRAELEEAVDMLHALMRQYDVEHSQDDRSLQGALLSLDSYLSSLSEVLESHHKAHDEWKVLRERLETELRSKYEEHQSVATELEAIRQERDEAKREIVELDLRIKALNAPTVHRGPPIEYKGEIADVVALLQPAWAVLPAPELRASTLNTRRHLRATSSASSPGGQSKSGLPSLSDVDVRSLKALYDAKSAQSAVGGPFSIEAFVARVQALVIDDRALIERLIRFAQAHDMLKKNAERAQKLAQDSNVALETYQKHVAALENQNDGLVARQSALINEIEELRASVERAVADKREIEMHAADQAETCRQLTEANNALSAKTLALAQEAAAAPEAVRKQLESQVSECREKLRKAEEEIHAMQTSEQTQRIALLDELNSMQTVNESLRAQLRATKR